MNATNIKVVLDLVKTESVCVKFIYSLAINHSSNCFSNIHLNLAEEKNYLI